MTTTSSHLADMVRSIAEEHRHERGPLIEMLHAVQERLGYVDPRVVPLLAAELNLSRADVHGVLTFYPDLRTEPAGRSVVKVCRGEACQSVGAEDLVASLEERWGTKLGRTTDDGAVTLEQVFCLGNCALGPSAEVDGRVHGRLDADQVVSLTGKEEA